jgi:protein BCP1
MQSNKKRQRGKILITQDYSDNDMDEDSDEIMYDNIPTNKPNNDDDDIEMVNKIIYQNTDNIVNVEFLFSPIREHYFHNIKTLVKLIFEFEEVGISGIADLILNQREEVGTVIKTEDEDQIKSNDVAILALITLISLHRDKDKEPVQQIINFILQKINTYLTGEQKELALKIMNSTKVGFLVNERAVNLPLELVPPMFNLHIEDIADYKYDNNNDTKYDTDYIVMVSK